MEFKPLFYSLLVLSAIVFFEVLIRIRKNSLLKVCFLLIIASLFVMNYYSYTSITNRWEFIVVKTTRLICILSVLLVIIQVGSPKIPRWIIGTLIFSFIFATGIRLYFFNQIDLGEQVTGTNLIFSVAREFYHPQPIVRIVLFFLLVVATGIILYYYRDFRERANKDNKYYRQMSRWFGFFIVPALLLPLFGMFSMLEIFDVSLSIYLYTFFSCSIILSILFRPKYLNTEHVSLAFLPIQKQSGSGISFEVFKDVFFDNHYYLSKEANMAQLAEKLGAPEANVREYLHEEYGTGFQDMLNKHRMAYLLDLFKDPKNKGLTIEHLSQKAGFPSLSNMHRAFSKFHGGDPLAYFNA